MSLNHEVTGLVSYTVVGSPTIVDGVASGFSNNDYLETASIASGVNTIEFNIKFTLANTFQYGNVLGYDTSATGISNLQAGLNFSSNYLLRFYLFRKSDNTIPVFALDQFKVNQHLGETFTANCFTDKSNVIIKLYDNLGNLVDSGTWSNQDLVGEITSKILIGRGMSTNTPGGVNSIDLNNTYITINGKAWFGKCPVEVKHTSIIVYTNYTQSGTNSITVNASSPTLNSVTLDGACEQNGTPSPDTPIDIVCNNGALKWDSVNQTIYADGSKEKVEVFGKNLWDNDSITITGNKYTVNKNDTGFIATAQSDTGSVSRVNCYLPSSLFKENTTYTLSGCPITRFAVGKADPSSSTGYTYYKAASIDTYSFTITDIDSSQEYVNIFFYFGGQTEGTVYDCTYLQIEVGNTATAYEVYYNGGRATAQNLLKVGTYSDTQKVLTGRITRKVGIKVLDGTENWVAHNTWYWADILPTLGAGETASLICTHFVNREPATDLSIYRDAADSACLQISYGAMADATALKTWLAAQYSAGTPVIVVYKKTDTTEIVTGQTLAMQNSTNTLEITQASIDNLNLAIDYTNIYTKSVNYIIKDEKLVFSDSGLYLSGPNTYTVQGSPTIVDNVVSSFSSSNFLSLPAVSTSQIEDMNTSSEIGIKLELPTAELSQYAVSAFFIPYSGTGQGIQFTQNSHKFNWIIETGYTIQTPSFNLDGSNVWLKCIRGNSTAELLYSTNGITYTSAGTLDISAIPAPTASGNNLTPKIGTNGNAASGWEYTGKIDLKETYIKIGANLWFYGPVLASNNIAPVPAGFTYGSTTTSAIGWVDMRTQAFTAASSGVTIGKDE